MIRFIIDFILAYIYLLSRPFIDLITLPFVFFKYGKKGFLYFDDIGYRGDIDSAGRNRTLWNTLFVRNGGFRFRKNTPKTISRILGINGWLNQLTIIGWFVYYALWVIDVQNWFKGGHCFQSMKGEDFYIPNGVELDGELYDKRK